MVSEDEWVSLNVSGTRGKQAISPETIQYVRKCTFLMYPIEAGENEEAAWKNCIRAIDAASKSLVKKRKLHGTL